MTALSKKYFTPEEYLEMERASPTKHEYYRGEVFAMAGASWNHGLIVGNVSSALRGKLVGGPCQVQTNDIKVQVGTGTAYSYPDVIALCAKPEFVGRQQDIVSNPELVIEVLSPSTEFYDRNLKLVLFQEIPTLKDYVLIAQDKVQVEHYTRGVAGWSDAIIYTNLADKIRLASLGCGLSLSEAYDGVEFSSDLPTAE